MYPKKRSEASLHSTQPVMPKVNSESQRSTTASGRANSPAKWRHYSDIEIINAFYVGEWDTIPKATKSRWLREANEWRVEKRQAAAQGNKAVPQTRIARALASADSAAGDTATNPLVLPETSAVGSEVGTGNTRTEALRAELRAAVHMRDKLAVAIAALLEDLIGRLPTMANDELIEVLQVLLDGYQSLQTNDESRGRSTSASESLFAMAVGRHQT